MKRVGFLKEKMMTKENFVKAERLLGKNKPDNKQAQYIAKNAERFGEQLCIEVMEGRFEWSEPRETTITDSYKGKTRYLKIPCLKDQAVQLAWLNIATPYIEKRNYYYNCGSIPTAGQTRCVKGLRKWLRNKRNKYGATSDIKKFYESCPHRLVRKGLKRIFKDKWFVDFGMWIVSAMAEGIVGLAIGFPSSHWFANVALMELDHELRRKFPDVKFTRYMDDIAMVASNFRRLKKALALLRDRIIEYGMKLKKWAIFKIKGRGITFLSYRFFNGYTLLVKPLMVRIARRMEKASITMNAHIAAGIVSYFGILKWCNSHNFKVKRVYPYVNIRACYKLIADKARKANEERNKLGYGGHQEDHSGALWMSFIECC